METGRPIWSSRAWPVAAGVLAGLVLPLLLTGAEGRARLIVPVLILAIAVATAAWALLRTRRDRRAHEDRLAAWAGERAAEAERLRIARDLHDLVSHGLGLITVRAASAARVTGPGGDAERTSALGDIEQVSRGTTIELRRMLTVLRSGSGGPAPLEPADTLDDLATIIDTARDQGLQVTHAPAFDLGDVSPGAQLTVCAVVREALDNVARHAGPTRAEVHVRRDGDAVVATVRDDGRVPAWEPCPGAGHGLVGLRERMTALGGTLHAAADEPGFVVVARIPEPGVA